MDSFKRNQVEEAIARLLERGAVKPSEELRSKIKRLLDTDRTLSAEVSNGPPPAFFSQESPGRGQEIWFSGYEAFALVMGLSLMRHGWPQGFVVKVLQRARAGLEFAYSTTLSHDPNWLFERVRKKGRDGAYALDNRDPFFLTIVSTLYPSDTQEDDPCACGVQRGEADAMKFTQSFPSGGGVTMFELARTAYNVSVLLSQTRPRPRGRC